MVTQNTIQSNISQCITLSKRLEDIASTKTNPPKSIIVGFGFLVRIRRLSQAISQLSDQYGYEKRIFIRSMIEMHITYAWIQLRNTENRANRYIEFIPLERLKILEDLEPSGLMSPDDYQIKLMEQMNRRSRVRHLFRNKIKRGKNKGKLQWDKNWASGANLEKMLQDVLKNETGKYDSFLYAIYRWFSSSVHGGPASLEDIIIPNMPLRAKPNPESDPTTHLLGAFVVLFTTIERFAKSLNAREDLEPEISKLQKALNTLSPTSGST